MLKRSITYEDFNGTTVTEDFYFNLSKPELIEMEVDVKGGFGKMLESIVKTEDTKGLITQFKRIVLLAYGEKSDDGKRFIKTDDIRAGFEQSAAYPVLFMELATDDKAATDFLIAVMPADMRGEMTKQIAAPAVPAPTPPVPPSS